MRHRHIFCVLACLFLGSALSECSFGQLSPDIVTSADPSPQKAVIDAYVAGAVTKLLSADSTQWASGRTMLLGELVKQGATPGFFDVYADSINTQFLKQLIPSKDARVRLNAAIIAARVAAKAANVRLAPLTLALLKDNSDGVVLWGLQTAKYVVPPLLTALDLKNADAIGKAAVQATKDHMTPAVIEEAYRTLLLDPNLPASDPRTVAAINPAMLTGFLPNAMALFEYRVKLYDEVDVPKQPVADVWACSFLVSEKIWSTQNPTQQGQILGLMIALLRGTQKQNAASSTPELIELMKHTGQAFQVISHRLNKPALTTAADKVAQFSSNTSGDEIATAVDNLDAAVKALGLPMPPAAP